MYNDPNFDNNLQRNLLLLAVGVSGYFWVLLHTAAGVLPNHPYMFPL
jgi:hypothetical protein